MICKHCGREIEKRMHCLSLLQNPDYSHKGEKNMRLLQDGG